AKTGVELELVAERDVHRAKPGTDRRRDRTLEGDSVLFDRLERLPRERRARFLHHVDAGLADVPVQIDTRRLEHALRRLRELRPGPVSWNEGEAVGHRPGRSERHHPRISVRERLSPMREDLEREPGPGG